MSRFGFIKLHRKFLSWEWYDNNNVKIVFLHLLLTANHKESEYHGIKVPAGSLITGYGSLSKQISLSVMQIRRAVDRLKSTSEINVISTNNHSIITLLNWDSYQAIMDTTESIKKPADKEPVRRRIGLARARPDDFKPNEKNIEYANKNGINLSSVLDTFIAKTDAEGKKYVDWNAGLRTYLQNAKKWNSDLLPPKPNSQVLAPKRKSHL